MSLRLRLTLYFSVFIALILTGVALAVYALTERSLNEAILERAQQAQAELRRGAYINRGLERLPADLYYQVLLLGSPETASIEDIDDLRLGVTLRPLRMRLSQYLSDNDLAQLVESGLVTSRTRLNTGENILLNG